MSDAGSPNFAPELILDYASPSAKTPLRLASGNIISITSVGDATQITETLAGHAQALAAIIFSSLTVTLLGCGVFGLVTKGSRGDVIDGLPIIAVYLIYAGVTLFLIFAVIHTSWRRTMLRVSRKQISLSLKSPLSARAYDWPTEEIRHVHVVQGVAPGQNRIVYQLRIEIGQRYVVQLFGGHSASQLTEIAWIVREYAVNPE